MNQPPPTALELVLIGCGHAHVHVLKMLGMKHDREILMNAGVRVTVITSHYHTPYSGMLPGYLAGFYTADDIHLDVGKLARFAGARLIHAEACEITYTKSTGGGGGGFIHTTDGRPPIRYDCLSIDIGSAPISVSKSDKQTEHKASVIPVKPIADFCQHYVAVVQDYCSQSDQAHIPYTVAVVGGGAGGIELTLALQYHLLHNINCERELKVMLLTRGSNLMETHNRAVRKIFARILQERNVQVYYQAEVERVQEDGTKKRLVFTEESAKHHPDPVVVDACFWCVTAGAAEWLSTKTPFETWPGNFLRVKDTYELIHHPGVFAAGDCCHMDAHPRPKAGVFAVRAGPVLKENLVKYLTGRPLVHHRPQSSFLGLISTGDKYAVASKGSWFCLEGAWLWHVKDWIDRKWMAKYSTELPDLEEMMASLRGRGRKYNVSTANTFLSRKGLDVVEAFTSDPMRCGGCGAKVGSTTVSRVLRAVHKRQVARAAELGHEPPAPIEHDDAAISMLPGAPGGPGAIIQTIDYFREIVNDPFAFGQIIAVHSLSDIHAMGAAAQTALTLAVAPFAADEAITESTLLHLLCGVSDVLQDEGVRLVGGHTCEGLELACGLSVQGFTEDPKLLLRKRGGQVGDKIVLTKPLGTGALFAAEMRAKARGEYVQQALDVMVQSSFKASRVARKFRGVHACTDITGFGLVGHLLEMLMANEGESSLARIGAVLDIRNIQFYRGGLEASANGILSTLHLQNARNRRAVINHAEAATAFPVEYPLLFDPQTAGGLMFFVDPASCNELMSLLEAESVNASVIGELEEYKWSPPSGTGVEAPVCTIGSGDSATGLRLRINCT